MEKEIKAVEYNLIYLKFLSKLNPYGTERKIVKMIDDFAHTRCGYDCVEDKDKFCFIEDDNKKTVVQFEIMNSYMFPNMCEKYARTVSLPKKFLRKENEDNHEILLVAEYVKSLDSAFKGEYCEKHKIYIDFTQSLIIDEKTVTKRCGKRTKNIKSKKIASFNMKDFRNYVNSIIEYKKNKYFEMPENIN